MIIPSIVANNTLPLVPSTMQQFDTPNLLTIVFGILATLLAIPNIIIVVQRCRRKRKKRDRGVEDQTPATPSCIFDHQHQPNGLYDTFSTFDRTNAIPLTDQTVHVQRVSRLPCRAPPGRDHASRRGTTGLSHRAPLFSRRCTPSIRTRRASRRAISHRNLVPTGTESHQMAPRGGSDPSRSPRDAALHAAEISTATALTLPPPAYSAADPSRQIQAIYSPADDTVTRRDWHPGAAYVEAAPWGWTL